MKKALKELFSTGLYLLIVLVLTYLLITYVGQRTEVDGASMENTLTHGDNLSVDKISYRFTEPERFDIIVFPFEHQKNTFYIKRIIGLPGESVRIDENGVIYINDEVLPENYGKEVIARISNNYVYPSDTVGYGVPQFYCMGNILYKGSYSSGTPIYCAENGYIYLYPKSNNQIVAQYTGYGSEALLCYVSLKYYKEHSTSASGYTSSYTSSSSPQNSASNISTGNSGGGCAGFLGFAGFFLFVASLGLFFNHPEWFCFVYLIPPVIYLLFSLKAFSSGEFKSSGSRAIEGFIVGAAIFLGICFVIAIIESILAQLFGMHSTSLGKQVLPGMSHFAISMAVGGIANAIVFQCKDK